MRHEEERKILVKPFVIGAEMVKPFTMGEEFVKPFEMEVNQEQKSFSNENIINENNYIQPNHNIAENCGRKVGEDNNTTEVLEASKKEKVVTTPKPITSVITKNIKRERAACGNFRVYLKSATYYISDTEDGENVDTSYEFLIVVYLMNGQQKEFHKVVRANDVKKADWVLSATGAIATECNTRKLKKWFSEMVQVEIENCNCHKRIYPSSGWRDTEYGKVYVYTEGAIGAEGCGICSAKGYSLDICKNALGTYDVFKKALNMTRICHSKRASTLIFLYLHASLLTTLFEKAGFPINFILGVIGITGSRKTSMCTAVAQLFNRERLKVDAEFTSTECGIEQTLSKYGDAIVIIDDFIVGETATEQAQTARKLQTLVRLCGNRVVKERMNFYSQGNKKPYFPIKGCCLLTGEQITGITSSISRMFITNIERDDVENHLLTFYQTNKWILPTHAYDFLQWCVENYYGIITFVENNFNQARRSVQFKHPRYAEMYATFYVVIDVFWGYALGRKFIDKNYMQNLSDEMKRIVLNELRENEVEIVNRDPGTILLKALNEAIKTDLCEVLEMTLENSDEINVIFEDKDFYYIQREVLGRIAFEYIKRNNINCSIRNDKSIITYLEAKGVLESKVNSRGYKEKSLKLPYQQRNSSRYLWINKEKLAKRMMEFGE